MLDLLRELLAHAREIGDGFQLGIEFGVTQTHDDAVQVDVFVARKFGLKPSFEFKERSDAPAHRHSPRCRAIDARK